ncbi:MFS transporter [bacterium]|nr:MFS transporter [bacterium]
MTDRASQLTKKQAVYGLTILALINSVNYMDRNVVTILFPLIKKDLLLTDTQLGLIGGLAFTLVYALAAVPIGWATDRFNRKVVLSSGIFVWSSATFLSGTAGSFATFFAARSLTATGEASCHPCGVSLISDYFDSKVRTTAIALFQMGIPLGAGLGIVLGGILATAYGWRNTFFIYAVPGIILIPFILMMKEPKRGAMEKGSKTVSPLKKGDFISGVRRILSDRSLLLQYSAALFGQFGVTSFSVWMPTFLYRVRGFDVNEAGKIMGIAFLIGGIVGTLGGATLADRWFRTDKTARIKVQILAVALGIPCLMCALLIDSRAVLIPAVFAGSIFAMAGYPICSAILVDLLNPRDRGVGMAFLLIVQNGIGLTLASLSVGAISDLTGSLLYGLFLAPVSMAIVIILSLMLKSRFLASYEAVGALQMN